jgi:glycosyltransferase involved in cell wall biosynthesis
VTRLAGPSWQPGQPQGPSPASARTLLVRARLTLAPQGTRRDRGVRLAMSALRLWRSKGIRGVWRRARSRLRGKATPAPTGRILSVPTVSMSSPGQTVPFGINPVALAAIEAVDQPLDPIASAELWRPMLDDGTHEVLKAYVVRILEATSRTARHRGGLPPCEARVRPQALKNDPLALVFLHRLCAIRDVRLKQQETEAPEGSPSSGLTPLEIADAETGVVEVSSDGVQTLHLRSRQGPVDCRINLGAALRLDPRELFAGGAPPASRPDGSVDPPCVSVVMPVYDRTDELFAALASVLNQDYPWCEIILVFNGSPDATLRLVPKIRQLVRTRRYRGRFPVLPYAYGGANVPRNVGSFLATGDLILFLDSDDVLGSADFVTRLAATARDAPDTDLFYPRTVEFVNVDRDHPIRGRMVASRPDVVTWNVMYTHGNVLNNSGVCVRTSAFHEVGGLDPAMEYCEDYELFLRLLGKTGRAVPVESGVRINLHRGNNEICYENRKAFWHERARESAAAFLARGPVASGGRPRLRLTHVRDAP